MNPRHINYVATVCILYVRAVAEQIQMLYGYYNMWVFFNLFVITLLKLIHNERSRWQNYICNIPYKHGKI